MVAVKEGLIVNTVGDVLTQPEKTAQLNSIITEKMPFFIPDISAKIYNFKFKIHPDSYLDQNLRQIIANIADSIFLIHLIAKNHNMNWKLIYGLSLFGLVMAFATVYWIPSNVEPYVWLPVFLLCAYLIAKNAPGKYFLHGMLVGIVNCVWITGVHIKLSADYIAHHPEEGKMYADMLAKTGLSLHRAMMVFGPLTGIISGIVLGLFAFAASKMFKKNRA